MPATESELDNPSTGRLVIRVKLIAQEPSPPPARWRLSRGVLLLIVGAIAVPLCWLGISTFRSEPTVPPTATEQASASSPKPATKTSATEGEAKSVESEVRQEPDAPPSAVDEVIPDVPQSALDTIRGTVRVSVRVTVDKQGMVVEAVADDRGPSRYFERLSVEASKQWTFTPANSEQRRAMLLKFNFTRAGVTADASPVQ